MGRLLGEIGTIEWCERTGGILGRGERARFLAATALRTARMAPRLLAMRLGARGGGPDPSALAPPDTATTRHILEACTELGPMLIEHGYRSYLYGKALGIAEGRDCDEEALFAGAFLHDYGISMMDDLTDRCFTLAGAEVAAEVLAATPMDGGLRRDVMDGITLHFNPKATPRQGDLQFLMHDGILLDVFGLRAWELDPAGTDRVLERHPRHGFLLRTKPAMQGHARKVHGCRAAPLIHGGFGPMVPVGPWYGRERAEA